MSMYFLVTRLPIWTWHKYVALSAVEMLSRQQFLLSKRKKVVFRRRQSTETWALRSSLIPCCEFLTTPHILSSENIGVTEFVNFLYLGGEKKENCAIMVFK